MTPLHPSPLHPTPLGVALRRSAADAGLLTVTAVLLALAAALAVLVPAGLDAAADRAVVAAAVAEPSRAAVVVQVPLGDSAAELSITADVLVAASRAQSAAVGAAVPGVTGEPVGSLEVTRLATVLADGEQGLTSLHLVHPWRAGDPSGNSAGDPAGSSGGTPAPGPGVTWTSGGPAGAPPDASTEQGLDGQTAPLAVGLAEPVARALGVGVGDPVTALLGGPGGTPLDVVVSGVYSPVDASDPVWSTAPGLLTPQVSGAGLTAATDVAALVDDAQVPALVALPAVQPVVTTTLPARPAALRAASAEATARALAALEAAPPSQLPGVSGAPARLRTDLDDLLRAAAADVTASRARASVLLAALVAGSAALVVLAASLLAARRARSLEVLRTRGAPLLSTAVETALEAAVVAGVGLVAGLTVASTLGAPPRRDSLLVLAPLLVLAVVAPAHLAVRRARAADAPSAGPPSRPSSRSSSSPPGGSPDRRGRALVVDAAVVLLAALALAALLGPRDASGPPSGPLVAASLPLGALTAALLGRRALLPLLAPLRSRAGRRGDAATLVATARLEAAARRTPVLVALVLTTAGASAAALTATSLATSSTTGPGGATSGVAATVLAGELGRHAVVVAVALALLGALAVVLDAVATAPQRRTEALATAALGVPRAARRAVALGELVPPAVVGAALGAVAGVLLALAAAGPLGSGG